MQIPSSSSSSGQRSGVFLSLADSLQCDGVAFPGADAGSLCNDAGWAMVVDFRSPAGSLLWWWCLQFPGAGAGSFVW